MINRPAEIPLNVYSGSFCFYLQTGAMPPVQIQAIDNTCPVQITATAHGIFDRQLCAVEGAKGCHQINAEGSWQLSNQQINLAYFLPFRVIDEDTLAIDGVNALDFGRHVADTGVIRTLSGEDLTGCTVTLSVADENGEAVFLLSTETDDIVIDGAWVTAAFSDERLAAIRAALWPRYALTVVYSSGAVREISTGFIYA